MKPSTSPDLPTAAYAYEQDFEQEDPFGQLSSCGSYTVNFKGLTTEKSSGGKRSFKLDVTFNEDWSYGRWGIPIEVPAEGQLRLSSRMFVDQATTGNVGLEIELRFAPTDVVSPEVRGLYITPKFGVAKTDYGRWMSIGSNPVMRDSWDQLYPEGEIAPYTRTWRTALTVERAIWGARPENVGYTLQHILLKLEGHRGERVVVYLDDLALKGQAPAKDRYDEEVIRRWANCHRRLDERIGSWRNDFRSLREWLDSIPDVGSEETDLLKSSVRSVLAGGQEKADLAASNGFIKTIDYVSVQDALETAEAAVQSLKKFASSGRSKLRDCDVYVTKPTSGIKILPDTFPVPGRLSDTIRMRSAAGVYEPASFVLRPSRDFHDVRLEVSDLHCDGATISAENIDIKVVKCWYQCEGAWTLYRSCYLGSYREGNEKVLTPELLLNDDSLVKVDYQSKNNYLKLGFPDGDRYVAIDDPTPVGSTWPGHQDIKDFPVRDADRLLPVDLQRESNKQFWLTVRVPEDTRPGIYSGSIKVSSGDGLLGSIENWVEVLPFNLSEPRTYYDPNAPFTSSLYCGARLDPNNVGTIGTLLNEQQYRRQMADLLAHGVTRPHLSQSWEQPEQIRKALNIRREAGLPLDEVYVTGLSTGNPQDEEGLGRLKERTSRLLDLFRQCGAGEVFIYGIDEAMGEQLRSQRAAWEAVHEAGAKVFTSGSVWAFETQADFLDVLIYGTIPDSKEADKWHGIGRRIWNYGNPQTETENPSVYRRYSGFLLWKKNFDGVSTWTYYAGADPWNDFSALIRTCGMVYPTADGVIDTIAWEGYREAIDDIRYGSTLRLAIEETLTGGDDEMIQRARDAQRYLDEMDPSQDDPDEMRERIISYILDLT
jgi:hypothetical protein